DCRQHVGQKMRTQSNPAESNQGDQQGRASNCQVPPVPRFHCRQNKKSELPIKQRCSNRVAAGKTVAGPIDERPVDKWTMSMDELLKQLVEQHTAGHSYDQCHERRPPSLPDKKQHREKQNDANPLARTELSERP